MSLRRRIIRTASNVSSITVVWLVWWLLVWPVHAVPAIRSFFIRGVFIWICGMIVTDTVLTWMNLDESTQRKWKNISEPAFAVAGMWVMWWLLVWPVHAVPATRGMFVWICGMIVTDTVLTWMNLDESTQRKWGYIGMAAFAVAGILYAAADEHCLLWWTACTQDSPMAH